MLPHDNIVKGIIEQSKGLGLYFQFIWEENAVRRNGELLEGIFEAQEHAKDII